MYPVYSGVLLTNSPQTSVRSVSMFEILFLQAYCDRADQENEKANNTDDTPVASEKKRKLESSENKDSQSPETPSNKKQTLKASDNTKSKLAAFAAS